MPGQQQRLIPERIDPESQFGQQLAVFEQQRQLARAEFDRFGNEQPLRLDRPLQNSTAQLFIDDPFVQRVLVDDR